MPETTAINYTIKELTALMMKDQGIKKGHWMIRAVFSWAVSNVVSPGGDASGPGSFSVLTGVGIQESAEPGPFTVDAATLWEKKPATRRRRKPKKA